ncbi:TlpA family protein disulfide reductase [Flavicella sediminum]|uniref:TlpA family protein disulfide reductase n=1 Tax=Flavicella sediminum TaxID=2585141 RepID=UPI001FB75FBA|nr:TlpA disulfide reductase family protein [Flavicella sediminum]
MKLNIMRNLVVLTLFVLTSCLSAQDKTTFSEEGLADKMVALDGSTQTFGELIQQFKGKTVLIDIWASWCGDCLQSMPKLKEIQKENPEMVYLFLSVDKSKNAWKQGIKKHGIVGEHYFIPSGWNGPFNSSIDLDWIPRFIMVDSTGKIKLWKAKSSSSSKLKKAIKTN